MPNYYTNFSFELELPSEDAIDYAVNLAAEADTLRWLSDEERKTKGPDFPKMLIDFVDNWSFEVDKEKGGIWIHTDEGGVDAACEFVRHLLVRFSITDSVSFEWANTCSKPCLDAYGGGAAIITPKGIKTMSTCDWVFKQRERMKKAKPGRAGAQTGSEAPVQC